MTRPSAKLTDRYFIGSNVVIWPLQALMAHEDGHEICVHTWSHQYVSFSFSLILVNANLCANGPSHWRMRLAPEELEEKRIGEGWRTHSSEGLMPMRMTAGSGQTSITRTTLRRPAAYGLPIAECPWPFLSDANARHECRETSLLPNPKSRHNTKN